MILNWLIGGPQGMGVDTSANSFARSCAYAGYWVFGKREYHSNITGEHSYFIVSVSDREIKTHFDPIDVLVSFEERTLKLHIKDVKPGGIVIYDEEIDIAHIMKERGLDKEDFILVPIPYKRIIKETADKFGLKDLRKLEVMRNSISVFASASCIGLPEECVIKSMDFIFTGRRRKVLEPNKFAGHIAYEYAKDYGKDFPIKLGKRKIPEKSRVILTGTQATALGKLVAGCRFQTYYPITPATDESEFLESLAGKYRIVVVQTEDEIAAITMATGASLAGARSATSTSGPGFSLMVEGMGWAGMNEVPVVIVNYQRGGPATGLPTRHEQADLKFAVYGAHGEFPRIVLSPGDIEEAFLTIQDAFNLAEKYQCPVIVLADKYLANSIQTIRIDALRKEKIDRGKIKDKPNDSLPDDGENNFPSDEKSNGSKKNFSFDKFRRFEITESGVSPRIFLGTEGYVFWNTGDEHDEFGHITESAENRLRMHEKRMKKLELVLREVPPDKKIWFFGDAEEEKGFVVVSWGSTKGAVVSAVEELRKEGIPISFLQVRMIHPLDRELIKRKIHGRIKIAVENNYSGQLAGLITEKTGEEFDHFVLKWTGRPMSYNDVYEALRKIVKGEAKGRIPLREGI